MSAPVLPALGAHHLSVPQKAVWLWSDPVKLLPTVEPRTSGAAPLLATLFSLFT